MNNTPIDEKEILRAELNARYPGKTIWDTQSLQQDFEVIGFLAPYCEVRHRQTGKLGTVEFNHSPRLYYNFQES